MFAVFYCISYLFVVCRVMADVSVFFFGRLCFAFSIRFGVCCFLLVVACLLFGVCCVLLDVCRLLVFDCLFCCCCFGVCGLLFVAR